MDDSESLTNSRQPPAAKAADPDIDVTIDAPSREHEERVLLMLRGDDVRSASDDIRGAGFTTHVCASVEALVAAMVDGAGVAVIADEIVAGAMAELFRVLDGQSTWSDLPVVVLVRPNAPPSALASMQAFERHPKIKTTFLQRPVPTLSLISAVRSGLQSRLRQYQVRDLLQTLEDEVKSRDAFLAMLGHELRNPVTSIGYVAEIFDMSAEELGPERLKWGAGVINRQVRHLSRLLDQLLDVARVQSGKIELEMGSVELNALVRQVVESFEPGARQRHLTLNLQERPVVVRGDKVRLSQVVQNLLDNAFKYTDDQGAIELRVEADADAALTVTDNGRGIKKDALPHVFKPFYQDAVGERAGAAGLGLGLAMVDNIVRLHGGTAEACSEGAGRGTTLTIRLPTAEGTAAVETEKSDAPVPALRLLVIEDDRELANVFAALLSSLGHEPHVVYDGAGGAERVGKLHPDMAFVDLGLPDIDGRDVARRVRAELGEETPPLVALTAYPQQDDGDSPFDDYLLKPVGRERVEQVLKKLAPRRRQAG
ncbi:MAG: hybrid sensor histidine kinase/response regulator [Gammaproteobacteria bacterium]|nr:hybrid sensor histidine kinase/response regulator [Gammaproteobacteria bacterium]